MNNRPIGIFDSGVGGLTVVHAVQQELPKESVIYYGDTARFPYGPRDLNEVRGFVFEICSFLERQGVKLIVIACNTGSAAGLIDAQKHFDIPILGVIEPGARAAVLATVNRHVGVIGTKGTIGSQQYDNAILSLDAGIKVTSRMCPLFVEYAEGKDIGREILDVADEYLAPLKEAGVDTVILGCTHYPLLKELIEQVMGPDVKVISSATETALEVKETLARRGFERIEDTPATDRFIVSGDPDAFRELGEAFLGREIKNIEQIRLGGT